MNIYPIQTGSVSVKQFQLTGASSNISRLFQLLFTNRWSDWMPIYSWLVVLPTNELVLIDTGETSKIFEKGYLPNSFLYHKAVQTRIKRDEEIDIQIQKLGYDIKDIKTLVLTHLHGDHIGGLRYFEHADILVSRVEYEMAIGPKGNKNGYFPKNWPSWFEPVLVEYTDTGVGPFENRYAVFEDDTLVIVPTPGHSIGHQSVILQLDTTTFFIGGDLTFTKETLMQGIPNVVLMNPAAISSVKKAKEYLIQSNAIYLSSHDPAIETLLKQL